MKRVKLSDNQKPELPFYEPHKLNKNDWDDAGGVFCPTCHQEVARLIPVGITGKHKICPDCVDRRRRLIEHKRRLLDLRRAAALARVNQLKIIT